MSSQRIPDAEATALSPTATTTNNMSEIDEIRRLLTTHGSVDRYDPAEFRAAIHVKAYSGTVDEAVVFVVQQAIASPVDGVVEKHLDGGRVVVAAGVIYVSRDVHGAILGMMADSRLRPDEQQPAARLRGLEG